MKLTTHLHLGQRMECIPYAFMAWCLVKHGDNFTFTFIAETSLRSLFSTLNHHDGQCKSEMGK